jgi:ribosomal protein S18 acetylase RimI-like enzyme
MGAQGPQVSVGDFQPFEKSVGGINLIFRPIHASDTSYVKSAWMKTCFDSANEWANDKTGYYKKYSIILDGLLFSEDKRLIRFVAAIDDYTIAGFCIADPSIPLLHYCHVKGSFRGQGIAREMLKFAGIIQNEKFAYTFETRDINRARLRGWKSEYRGGLL